MIMQTREAVEFVQIRLPPGGAQHRCNILLAVAFVSGGRRILRIATYQVGNECEEPVVTALDVLGETFLHRHIYSCVRWGRHFACAGPADPLEAGKKHLCEQKQRPERPPQAKGLPHRAERGRSPAPAKAPPPTHITLPPSHWP